MQVLSEIGSCPFGTGYRGKVRHTYRLIGKDETPYFLTVTTDRVSAFDVVSTQAVPYKGLAVNTISRFWYQQTRSIVPNWVLEHLHPLIDFGYYAKPFPVEFIVRRYLTGSLLKAYQKKHRQKMKFCGAYIPAGLPDNAYFSYPLFTPTTKAVQGHDQNISPAEIVAQQLMTRKELTAVIDYALALFLTSEKIVQEKGLTFVDAKYEFGKLPNETIVLIDEVNTPDSSRYRSDQEDLSKEYLRAYLKKQNYYGDGPMPVLPIAVINKLSEIDQRLAIKLTGEPLPKLNYQTLDREITAVMNALQVRLMIA